MIRIYLSIILLIQIILADYKSNYEYTQEAQNKLKIYGFTKCLYQQYKNSVDLNKDMILKDIMIASSSYSFMGVGNHTILQNEKTLETIYNPYKETIKYIKKVYPTIEGVSKSEGKPVVMINCFKIYNSKEFDEFIKKQDKYIQ